MLPFCAHFPSRYQFNARKVPLCTLGKGKKIPSHQVIEGTKFLIVVLSVCASESPIWNVAHITLLASRTLMWGLDL